MTKAVKKPPYLYRAIAAAVLLCCSPVASFADPWDFGVNIDIGAIYTDNVFLEQNGLEEDENIYTIVPELYLTKDGDRIDADMHYRPEAYFYDTNSDADEVFHVVDATMTAAMVRDRLFLFLSASNFQSIVTPEGQLPTSNIPISGNRVDSRVLEARPYWDQRIGSADVLLELSYTDLDYDDNLFEGNAIKRGRFELDNKDRQQGFAWGVSYDHTRSEYDNSLSWEFQRAALDLGYWINGSVRIFGVGGVETDYNMLLEPNLDEDFWEGGLQYRPSQRLNLELAAGERSYGSSFRFTLDFKLKRGNTSLNYTEGPTTGAELPTGRRPITDTDSLDGILDRPGRSDRFVRKRLEWLTTLELAKSNLSIRLFGEMRDQRSTDVGMPLEDEEYAGVAVRWSWRAGVNTTFGVGGDFARRDILSDEEDLLKAQFDIEYKISEKISLRAEIVHSSEDGRESEQFDYDENQARLLLRMAF